MINADIMYTFICLFFSFSIKLQIFEMMDAKARQDCIKEIGLLQVCMTVHVKDKEIIF